MNLNSVRVRIKAEGIINKNYLAKKTNISNGITNTCLPQWKNNVKAFYG